MDESSRANNIDNDAEPHLEWCRRSYELADGSTWKDPFDCQEEYAGPGSRDYADIECLLMEGVPDVLAQYLYQAMVDIAGEDWARHSLAWTLGVDDFATRTAFVIGAPTSPTLN